MVTTVAGNGGSASVDGISTRAGFTSLTGVAVDNTRGVLYVVDNSVVRSISLATLQVSTSKITSSPTSVYFDDTTRSLVVRSQSPSEMNTIYVYDGNNVTTPPSKHDYNFLGAPGWPVVPTLASFCVDALGTLVAVSNTVRSDGEFVYYKLSAGLPYTSLTWTNGGDAVNGDTQGCALDNDGNMWFQSVGYGMTLSKWSRPTGTVAKSAANYKTAGITPCIGAVTGNVYVVSASRCALDMYNPVTSTNVTVVNDASCMLGTCASDASETIYYLDNRNNLVKSVALVYPTVSVVTSGALPIFAAGMGFSARTNTVSVAGGAVSFAKGFYLKNSSSAVLGSVVLNATAGFTLVTWHRIREASPPASALLSLSCGEYAITVRSSGAEDATIAFGSSNMSITGALPRRSWATLVVVYAQGNATVYVDGLALKPMAVAQAPPLCNYGITLGSRINTSVIGDVAAFHAYGYGLAPLQVGQVAFDVPAPPFPPPTSVYALSTGYALTTVAGDGLLGTADGVGGSAEFKAMAGITFDGVDTLYVADRGTVRKVSASTMRTTTWGGVACGDSVFFDANTQTLLCAVGSYVFAYDALGTLVASYPDLCSANAMYFAVDAGGNFYVNCYADDAPSLTQYSRTLNPTAWSKNATLSCANARGAFAIDATGAPWFTTGGVFGDCSGAKSTATTGLKASIPPCVGAVTGNLYAFALDGTLLMYDPTVNVAKAIVGSAGSYAFVDGYGSDARLAQRPGACVSDANETLYVSDLANGAVRKVALVYPTVAFATGARLLAFNPAVAGGAVSFAKGIYLKANSSSATGSVTVSSPTATLVSWHRLR